MALFVGIVGFEVNLAIAVGLGLALWWLARGVTVARAALSPSG
jgi:hypothetical protein